MNRKSEYYIQKPSKKNKLDKIVKLVVFQLVIPALVAYSKLNAVSMNNLGN
jgi:hypothetical protein